MNEQINLNHYTNISDSYNSNFLYSEENNDYQEWILSIITKEFNLTKYSHIADIGAGSGSFSNKLSNKIELINPLLCVDNNIDMLNIAKKYSNIRIQCTDAQTFAAQHNLFDFILLKEIIHHIPILEMNKLFIDLEKCLTPTGSCLIITRPSEIDYPLFTAARKVWAQNQPSKDVLLKIMNDCGLNVTCISTSMNMSLSKEKWYNMIRTRCWSTFSYFNDEELEEGIKELELKFNCIDEISFREELLFIMIKK
jgi:2-polyprenyl-3-methyl-5-hydroxy-6-metoxy-1,4-benzoquinol methylase